MLRCDCFQFARNDCRQRVEEGRGHGQTYSGEPFAAMRAGQLAGEQDHHAAKGEE